MTRKTLWRSAEHLVRSSFAKNAIKKEIVIILLAAVLVMTACRLTGPTAAAVPGGETIQIPNPWRDATWAEVETLYPGSICVPEGAENARWSIMDTEGASALVQLIFDMDGYSYTAREQMTGDRTADISGMYYTWTAQNEITLQNWGDGNVTGTYFRHIGADGCADLCVWFDAEKGISYSVSVTSKDLEGFDLQAIAEALHDSGTVKAPISIEEQRRILEENRSLWAFDEGDHAPDWYYTFTDLDHNGLLEVISASTQGTGIFTYAHYYEVLPDGSGVKNLYHADAEIEGPDDWPEIIRDTLPCYYDRAADRYYYICTNDIRDGAAHARSQVAALCLKNGSAEWEYLTAADIQATDTGEQTSYSDAAGNPISEQEYHNAVERRFSGMEKTELKLEWIAVTSTVSAIVAKREDGERFESVIILEGMEEPVQYEHISNRLLGLEMDYDYESFIRQSGPDRERFVSVWDDPQKPENYLDVTTSRENADTVAESVKEELSRQYDLLESTCELDHAGSCLRIEASELKGTGNMANHLQAVYIIPASDGCRIATIHSYITESEGLFIRFAHMLNTLTVLDRDDG